MRILDRLPVDDKHHRLEIHGESLTIRPFQIIVEVSISDALTWDARTPIIPALLDTGNNHNFSIQEHQLSRWAGIQPQGLAFLGTIREGERTPSLRRAHIWIHRNQSGARDRRVGRPFLLALEEGIATYPSDGSNYPRIPLLGLRAIIKNNLRLVIEGKRKFVSLATRRW
jgi:hypothetical protein